MEMTTTGHLHQITQPHLDPFAHLQQASAATIRSYEDAATAVGRFDGSASLAPMGLRELLILRCIVTPSGASRDGMIALLRPGADEDSPLHTYESALRTGAAESRGGVIPSVEALHDLLGIPLPR